MKRLPYWCAVLALLSSPAYAIDEIVVTGTYSGYAFTPEFGFLPTFSAPLVSLPPGLLAQIAAAMAQVPPTPVDVPVPGTNVRIRVTPQRDRNGQLPSRAAFDKIVAAVRKIAEGRLARPIPRNVWERMGNIDVTVAHGCLAQQSVCAPGETLTNPTTGRPMLVLTEDFTPALVGDFTGDYVGVALHEMGHLYGNAINIAGNNEFQSAAMAYLRVHNPELAADRRTDELYAELFRAQWENNVAERLDFDPLVPSLVQLTLLSLQVQFVLPPNLQQIIQGLSFPF